jgi:hypothetical protein
MPAVTSGFESGGGREVIIDLARAAAGASGSYANFALTRVDDHVVRLSVITEPFYWHRHPDSDETVEKSGMSTERLEALVRPETSG